MVIEYKVRQGNQKTCYKSYHEKQARAVYEALVNVANFDSPFPPYYELVKVETVHKKINDKETQTVNTVTILEKTE